MSSTLSLVDQELHLGRTTRHQHVTDGHFCYSKVIIWIERCLIFIPRMDANILVIVRQDKVSVLVPYRIQIVPHSLGPPRRRRRSKLRQQIDIGNIVGNDTALHDKPTSSYSRNVYNADW